MRSTCLLAIAALTAGLALPGAAPAEATHDRQYRAEAPEPVDARRQPPVRRQNFRARTADEIPPWEGFEDCLGGVPCVGMMGPVFVPHPRRR